jgi:hypothetical protein|nr:hypothetical protein [Kofleriaceae bacterium]
MSGARIVIVAAICAAGAHARTAHASPVDDPTIGRAVFTGATVPSATSIVLDPAAIAAPGPLGAPPPDAIYVGLTSTLDQIGVSRRLLDVDTGALSQGASVHDVVASPGADVGAIFHANPSLALGLQLRMPPGQQFIQDEPALRYYTLGGYQRDVQASLGLGVRVASMVWVGASVTIDATLLRLRFARDTALEAAHGPTGVGSACGGSPCGVENPAASETYDVTVRQHAPFSDGYIVNLGGIVRLAPNTFLAISYHTPPGGATSVENELDGDVTVIRPPRDGGGTLHGAATVYISQPASVDAELRTRLRDDLDLHVGGRWQNLSREAGWDVRMYGDLLSGFGVPEWTEKPRGFHDTFALWGGVEQVYLGERLRLGARLGIESSAIDDAQTSAVTIAPASATLDLGAQLHIAPQVVVQLSYGLQVFERVSETASQFDPRDRIACVDGGYDYSTAACGETRAGYAIPTADADYSRIEHAIRLGVRYDIP